MAFTREGGGKISEGDMLRHAVGTIVKMVDPVVLHLSRGDKKRASKEEVRGSEERRLERSDSKRITSNFCVTNTLLIIASLLISLIAG